MSYDVYLRCEHCRAKCGQELPEPTYNLTEIFDLALTGEEFPDKDKSEFAVVILHQETERPRGLRVLSGRKARDTQAQIAVALERMADPKLAERFKKLEPENGWGTIESAVECMQKYQAAAIEYPDHVWEIH